MSNSRPFRRRRYDPAAEATARAHAARYRCPDCTSVSRVVRRGPGVYLVDVRHDDTCPSYRRLGNSRRRSR